MLFLVIMARANQGGRTGRIRPDERDTNDNVAILGPDVIGTEAHMASLQETKKCAPQNRARIFVVFFVFERTSSKNSGQ